MFNPVQLVVLTAIMVQLTVIRRIVRNVKYIQLFALRLSTEEVKPIAHFKYCALAHVNHDFFMLLKGTDSIGCENYYPIV